MRRRIHVTSYEMTELPLQHEEEDTCHMRRRYEEEDTCHMR
jgi:hypothetical protein